MATSPIPAFGYGTSRSASLRRRLDSRWSSRAMLNFAIVVLICGMLGVCADQAREMPTQEFPLEGPIGPDTYVANAALIACTQLNPYPSAVEVPWNPTVAQAKTFCGTRANCGGFVYRTASANQAQSGSSLATALYCIPRSFTAGTMSATSGVAFVRHVYDSCDVRISLSSSTTTHYGALSFTRQACIRPGRGLSPARDRTPIPDPLKYAAQPTPTVILSSVTYKVGSEVFVTADAARNASVDGTSHAMNTVYGVTYYMPGASHATKDQSEKPFLRDGWYPLYSTKAGAQAASIRTGGNGVAHEIGPTTSNGLPTKWLTEPHLQNHWMPSDGSERLYTGDFVGPFALDGYYPLYRVSSDAAKVSSTGVVQSHGPGSDTGHPLSWSTGQNELFYMPAAGPTLYYGNYYDASEATVSLYSYADALYPTSPVGTNVGATSAAWVAAFQAYNASEPATTAAVAILSAAPNWVSR